MNLLFKKTNHISMASEKNLSNYPQPPQQRLKLWFLPYVLNFALPLTLSISYLLYPPSGIGKALEAVTIIFYWGLFVISCVSYFVIRKIFIKKPGFRYSFFVFLLNPLMIYTLMLLDADIFFMPVFFTLYFSFILIYIVYLLSRKH